MTMETHYEASGYENAPATRLVATRCAVCSRPLVDAVSVETGVGPVCRRKAGLEDAGGPSGAARDDANSLIYLIAAEQNTENVGRYLARLRDLGFTKAADAIFARLGEVTIELEGDVYALSTPKKNDAAVELFRRIPGRRWDAARNVNTFPVQQRRALWEALKACYGGTHVLGPKGFFTVPA